MIPGPPPAPVEPWVALGLSVLVPGLGQAALGRTPRGVAWFALVAGAMAGFLGWVLSPARTGPWEAAGWVVLMGAAELGNWIDAWRLARAEGNSVRALPPPRRPEPAAALSLIVPGLGQAYLWSRRWWYWPLLLPPCLLPAGFLLLANNLEPGMLEHPAAPTGTGLPIRWPAWAMDWPDGVSILVAGALSATAIVHAWLAGCRAAGRPIAPPALPRTIAGIAATGWLLGLLPWEGWLKDHVVRSFVIPSPSMEPTLRKDDRLWARRTKRFDRFDIVVFRPPDRPDQDYIKRVIGVPGDTIRIRGTRVLINGTPLREAHPVWRAGNVRTPILRDFGPVEVPEGCYFLLGDNRDESRDSRYFGSVPGPAIYGRAYKIFWPPARSGPLD